MGKLPTVLVDSLRFGSFEVPEDRVLTIDNGLLGFPASQRYVLVESDRPDYVWLQSVDESEVAFLATAPWSFFPDYELSLSDDDQAALELSGPASTEVLCLLTVHRSDAGEPTAVTANLLGPLVLNTENRRARQVVMAESSYGTREPLGAG